MELEQGKTVHSRGKIKNKQRQREGKSVRSEPKTRVTIKINDT